MESILIRNLPEGTKARLAARAQRNRRSMEAEARDILGAALEGATKTIVDFLAHPESVEIEFDPERLGATARTADL
ncbi:FitA-like ribbon-helix-helix domain-containing protein [Gryllotalpicola koreensis]|uniref:Antitoxin n=1 Tax=Gryllotalpicola koreensis TaxID=993086 RepID=A0ABP7ZY08_9MICO